MKRQAGVLLHISSLPSPHGIGTMGRAAFDFVDFLAAAGQSCWQILPISPTGFGDSPYQPFSGFAGNPYFIDLDLLVGEGLLQPQEIENIDWESTPEAVNYNALYQKRMPVLRSACTRLLASPPADYADFCQKNAFWLGDYALFMSIKLAGGGMPWSSWPEPLRRRDPAALAEFARARTADLDFWQAVQYLFFRQWNALKAHAGQKGIAIIGDMPIYVAQDSVEVWSHPEQFQLDATLTPTEVAGCPPDGFSATGQLWGNPLFDWDAMEQDNFSWWRQRVAHQKGIYDVLRIDHFRGLESYYAIPGGAADACCGRWRKGPGMKLLNALFAENGREGFVAEDLGFLTPAVYQLLAESGLPGMKVLEFAFDTREDGDYLPHTYLPHCAVYTGTHDNSTVMGWAKNADPADVAMAREYLGIAKGESLAFGMMRGVWSSVGELAVVQMQDLLQLDDSARMNEPGTVGKNWRWRMLPGAATPELAQLLRRKMALYGRLPG